MDDTIRLPAVVESLEPIRSFTLSKISEWGFSSSILDKLDLVLEELLTNVFKYAYPDSHGDLELSCKNTNDSLMVSIRDWGPAFNPLESDPPNLSSGIEDRQIGGLGIHLVREIVDDIHYRRSDNTNILTFTLKST